MQNLSSVRANVLAVCKIVRFQSGLLEKKLWSRNLYFAHETADRKWNTNNNFHLALFRATNYVMNILQVSESKIWTCSSAIYRNNALTSDFFSCVFTSIPLLSKFVKFDYYCTVYLFFGTWLFPSCTHNWFRHNIV